MTVWMLYAEGSPDAEFFIAIFGAIFIYIMFKALEGFCSTKVKATVIVFAGAYFCFLIVLFRTDIIRQLNFIIYRNFQLYVADNSKVLHL